mmetsp:Transcript_54503/g.100840  ORF Transcript_54503/g.100840 Transcript_54503/m.100840 type:complete len:323 (-) Transcript_54503:94-1062(-)
MAVKRLWGKFSEGFRAKREAFGAYLVDLTHARQRLVLKHQDRFQKLGFALGNGGYFVGGMEYAFTDIFYLRVFAACGAGMVVCYQLCQPRVQWLTAGWNMVYAFLNWYQLSLIRKERWPSVELTAEAKDFQRLYDAHLSSIAHLDALLQLGDFVWLVDGAVLTEQGLPADQSQIYFITSGSCDVLVDDEVVKSLGPGDVVGEMALLAGCPESSATVVAAGSVRCYAVPAQHLKTALESDIQLKAAIEGLFLEGLATKVAALNEQVRIFNYQAVLEMSCSVHEYVEGLLSSVSDYRGRHNIPDSVHNQLMQEIPQCSRHLAVT